MKPWNKFDVADYKMNYRAFNRYKQRDELIIQRSPLFQELSDQDDISDAEYARAKRRANNVFTSDPDTTSPVKKKFCVGEDTTDEEDEDT